MQADAGFVGGVDAGYNGVITLRAGRFDQGLHQESCNALTPLVLGDIDRILHRILIGGPGTEGAI